MSRKNPLAIQSIALSSNLMIWFHVLPPGYSSAHGEYPILNSSLHCNMLIITQSVSVPSELDCPSHCNLECLSFVVAGRCSTSKMLILPFTE